VIIGNWYQNVPYYWESKYDNANFDLQKFKYHNVDLTNVIIFKYKRLDICGLLNLKMKQQMFLKVLKQMIYMIGEIYGKNIKNCSWDYIVLG